MNLNHLNPLNIIQKSGHESATRSRYAGPESSYWELNFECGKIPKLDAFSPSDPFIVAYLAPDDRTDGTRIVTTETLWDNPTPSFVSAANIPVLEGVFDDKDPRVLHLEVYDRDSDDKSLSRHDFIGQCTIKVAELLTEKARTKEIPLLDLVSGTSANVSFETQLMHSVDLHGAFLIITAEKISMKTPADLHLASIKLVGIKSDCYFVVSKEKNLGAAGKHGKQFIPLFRSKIIDKYSSTHDIELFESKIPFESIGSDERLLRFAIHKHVMGGENKIYAAANASVNDLIHSFNNKKELPVQGECAANHIVNGYMTVRNFTQAGRTRTIDLTIEAHHDH